MARRRTELRERIAAPHCSLTHGLFNGILVECVSWAAHRCEVRKPARPKDRIMNRIIWLVGLVVIVLFIAGYLGLR